MDDNKSCQCPRCGSKQHSVQHAGGETTTFLLCKKCGYKATPKAWKKKMQIGDSFNLASIANGFNKKADEGIGGTSRLPSSNTPEEQKPDRSKRYHSRGKINKKEELTGEHPDQAADPRLNGKIKSMGAINMTFNLDKIAKKELKKNAFNLTKLALIEELTKEQIERKNFGKNMVAPEGRQDIDKKSKDSDLGQEKYIGAEENRRFDTIDRKDMHSSPDPKQIIPGYKEWYDREVDKYYDGWLDDHIENSGGKIVGSNTEKTMNLKDNERYHAPEYPREAAYEKLLESRHNFDEDYIRFVAKNNKEIRIAKNDFMKKINFPKDKLPVEDCWKALSSQDEKEIKSIIKSNIKNFLKEAEMLDDDDDLKKKQQKRANQ